MTVEDIMKISPIIPVISLENENDALDLAYALIEGGINIMEITLRTKAALKSIEIIADKIPQMNLGAGTVCNKKDFEQAISYGAKFVFSPGISQELIDYSKEKNIPFIPGVATASELMLAQNNDLTCCKLFPATLSGGVEILKAFSSVFSKMRFCPTGGINIDNMNNFLKLKNVLCVGGSWIVAKELIEKKDFNKITTLTKEALASIS